MRRFRHRHNNGKNHGEYQPMVATWMIRLLLEYNWVFKTFFKIKDGYEDEDVAEYLQLPEFDCDKKLTVQEVKKALKKNIKIFENSVDDSLVIFCNVDLLSQRIEISSLDKKILVFALLVENTSVWGDLFRSINIDTEQQFLHLLACMLDESVKDVKQALSKKSFLRQSGMISLEKSSYEDGKLDLMNNLEEALFAENNSEEELISHFLIQSKPGTLCLNDYPHAKQDIGMIKDMIKAGASVGVEGVNILMYGTPGTGKTELARLIAKELKLNLFEVKTENDDGDAIKSSNRLSSYRLSQQLLSQDESSLILFDEVEDVFPARSFSFFGMEISSGENKGWMNKTLEENKTPAIWVCNKVSQIDSAFLRRFDYVMELNTPPKSVRLNIVKSYLEDKSISADFLEKLAEHKELSPALIANLSKVASRINESQENLDDVLLKVVNNSLKAMSFKPLSTKSKDDTHYDFNYLNTNIDMNKLIKGLQRSKKGNLCFYGAPGTGKTALAGYIAKQLDKPLLSKKASDILGMYVGQSEKNIAAMFEEAKQEEAVLVLDEADSLLRDRRGAKQSWEVSQVNELLVQMENFDGLFICSTNLMDDLDQASMRRFAIKVKFDYLKPEQACRMLEKECVGVLSDKDKRDITSIGYLAPGDFSAVKKRLDILGIKGTAGVMIQELKEEVLIKSDHHTSNFGFIH